MLQWGWLLGIACLIKLSIAASFTCIFVYTPEAFPTRIRNLAVSSFVIVARVSGIITPSIAWILLDECSSAATFLAYAAAGAIGTASALALPFDTLGRDADVAERGGDQKQFLARPTEKSPLVVA